MLIMFLRVELYKSFWTKAVKKKKKEHLEFRRARKNYIIIPVYKEKFKNFLA